MGIDSTRGYLQDGIDGWTRAGLELAELPQINARLLNERLQNNQVHLLDVRRKPEWQSGHIEDANWLALDDLKSALTTLDREAPIAVICEGGYRSLIASSILKRAGFPNVTNVMGGFIAWEKARLPFLPELPATG